MTAHIEGLIAAPLTALGPDGSPDLDKIPAQVAMLARDGVKGAFVCGTTGESLSLTTGERKAIAQAWVETAPPGFAVIVHVGHNSIETSVHLAQHAEKIGAHAVGAMAPSFFKPDGIDTLVEFCARVAAGAPTKPFYYYHIPSLTGVAFPMVQFLGAAADRIPTLAGLKFTDEDLMDFERCRRPEDGRFDVLFGRDEILLCALALGARGAVGSTYNFAAPLYLKLIAAFDEGDLAEARRLQFLAMEAVAVMQRARCSFFAAAKAIMRLRGLDLGPVRAPLRDVSPAQHAELARALDRIGFLAYCGA